MEATTSVTMRATLNFVYLLYIAGLAGSDDASPKHTQADRFDLYLDDRRLFDDITPGQATGFVETVHLNTTPTLYLVDGDDPDASEPLDSFAVDLLVGEEGNQTLAERSLFLLAADADNRSILITRHNPRTEAADPSQAEMVFVHANAEAPPLTLRLIDDTNEHNLLETLAEEVAFGSLSDPLRLNPSAHNLEVIASDGSQTLGVFRLDVSGHSGQVLTVAATSEEETGAFAVAAYDTSGAPVASAVVTATEDDAALPQRMVLQGNYPNPFNPSTQLIFDLPEAAVVRVELFDMLGRRVLALPATPMAAGAGHTLPLDASSLSSGVYLYRLIAETTTHAMSETGRLMLMK